MGHEIVYCTLCGARVVDADFDKGAFRIDRTISCVACRAQALGALTPSQRSEVERRREAAPVRAPATAPPVRRPAPAAKKGNPLAIIIGAVAVGIVGIVGIVALLASKPSTGAAPEPKAAPVRPDAAREERQRRIADVQRALDDALVLQAKWEAKPAVLEAYARAAGAAGSDQELTAKVDDAKKDYLARFEQAARDAARPGLAAEEYAEVSGALAGMAPVFADSEAGRQLKTKAEAIRKKFGIGEWRPVFDGQSLAGWTRYVAGPKIKDDNWKCDKGSLLGTSSFPTGRGTSDELVFNEQLTEYELEITWSATGEPADGSASALVVLPRIVFKDGKRVGARGFARWAHGGAETATMVVTAGSAEFRVNGKVVGTQPVAAEKGQLCFGITPGMSVRISSARMKRAR